MMSSNTVFATNSQHFISSLTLLENGTTDAMKSTEQTLEQNQSKDGFVAFSLKFI